MNYHEQEILNHAKRHIGGRGDIRIQNGTMGPRGLYEATVILTTRNERVFYHGFHGGAVVGMTESRHENLNQLPLFQTKAH